MSNIDQWIEKCKGPPTERRRYEKIEIHRPEVDYEKASAEFERLWGSKNGTTKGDRLDLLANLIEAYEAKHDGDPEHEMESNKVLGTRATDEKVDHCALIRRAITR